jgi:hypothetical protein
MPRPPMPIERRRLETLIEDADAVARPLDDGGRSID